MPVADPTSGRLFIWLIASFLLICITVGGACLIAYVVLPQDQPNQWLPVVGVALVCLPWAFWLFTCFYRLISRICGFRVSIGRGFNVNDGGDGGSKTTGNEQGNQVGSAAEEDGKNVQFGGAVVVGGGGKSNDNDNVHALSISSSCNDMSSVVSDESERPLNSSKVAS
ncbi:hypothetical protein K2173_012075 [Erythroxylum novogranatense]|uniref:Membrane lipoprotein n=1 Tax=Erythroxylum novogranatense TaxID=1862640 RepID=A0AAV8THC5_9ROSI|nr:hypothetical protein K2173_012075 [Erythroxylum novogranatense]